MSFEVRLARSAAKNLKRAPKRDQDRLLDVLKAMRENPLAGDIEHLRNHPIAWRRRVGNWRILFNVYPEEQLVDVVDVVRRTSKTY